MDTTTAKERLQDWGDFMRGQPNHGFPTTSIIGRCIDDGPGASHDTGASSIETPPDIQHVEKVVLSMEPPIKKVIRHKYIFGHTQEETATLIGKSRPTVEKRLEAGVTYLAGTLFNFR